MPTDRTSAPHYSASIFIPGLYSLQCVSRTSGLPDVTFYRENLDALVGSKSLLSELKGGKRFAFFVLRQASDKCDFFDKGGRLLVDDPFEKPEPLPRFMSGQALSLKNDDMARHIAWLLPQPTVCGSFEAHAGQSAADRSNFYTMLDQLVNLAPSDKEREHTCVLTQHWPCPRSLLVADLTLAAPRTQEVFLDHFMRIRKGWPLHEQHHRDELARTLASCRFPQLSRWLKTVRMQRNPSEDPERFDLVMASISAQTRLDLATILVRAVYKKFILSAGGVEQMPDDVLIAHADAIGGRVDELLGKPVLMPASKT